MKFYITQIIIIFLLLSSSFVGFSSSLQNPISGFDKLLQPQTINDSDLITEYTWSIMRYDHVCKSDNFGIIDMPKPTPGIILIPVNMMSIEVCRSAVSVFHEDKMDTLETLEEYDLNNMVVGIPYIFWRMWASSKHSVPYYGQKASTQEMGSLAKRFSWANFIGDCYSQSAFNTAILRLCGFSPEEVFSLLMPAHAVTIVKINDKWFVFDSVQAQFTKKAIYDSYYPPIEDIIYWLENDKYFINFGTAYPEYFPYQENPFSNIDSNTLISIVENIVPLFNNSKLGGQDWEINEFIENATASPDMITIEVPYTVEDAVGSTNEEKAHSLLELNKAFVFNHTSGEILNQYDRSLYGLGLLSVEYPQAYANASKFASWTSWFAKHLDTKSIIHDYFRTAYWIKFIIKNQQILPEGCVSFSDFSYIRRAGSSIDQAIIAYGTLRNMIKDYDLWQPEDLYILVTDDNKGYLAVNVTNGWKYLNFEKGKTISDYSPEYIKMVFNENEHLSIWIK